MSENCLLVHFIYSLIGAGAGIPHLLLLDLTQDRAGSFECKSSAVAQMGDGARAKWPKSEGGVAVTFPSVWGAGSPSNIMSPGPRPNAVPSGIPIHPAVWPQ